MIVDLSQGDSRVQVFQPREMRSPNDYYEGHGELPEPEPQPEVVAQQNAEDFQSRMQQAAEGRARRGIPAHGHEITGEEKRQEMWRIFFNMIFDAIGLLSAINIVYFNEQTCNKMQMIRFWFMGYAFQAITSIVYQLALLREILKNYLTRNSELIGLIVDISMLLWALIGNYLFYYPGSDCHAEAPEMIRIFGNVIMVLYLRLIQIILIAILVLICCPLIFFCGYLREQSRVAVGNDIIKNLNHLQLDDFKAYKRYTQRLSGRLSFSSQINDDDLQETLIQQRRPSSSEISADSHSQDQEEEALTCAICLEEFKDNESVVALPCKAHSFHPSCIEQWLKVNSVCPECRFNVAKENLEQQKKDMKKAFKEIKKERKQAKGKRRQSANEL